MLCCRQIIRFVFIFVLLSFFAVNQVKGENIKYNAICVWTSETTYDCYCFTECPKMVINGDEVSVYIGTTEIQTFSLGPSVIKVTYGVYEAPSNVEPKVMNKNRETGVCYDMHGRRILGTPTVKGVYIIDGNKVLIK